MLGRIGWLQIRSKNLQADRRGHHRRRRRSCRSLRTDERRCKPALCNPILRTSGLTKRVYEIMQKSFLFTVALVSLGMSACGYPALTSAMRSSPFPPDTVVETKCVHIDRDTLSKRVVKFSEEGWRLVYASEYTSTARSDMPSIYCFERPAEKH